jgi:hypothetical protein
MSNRLNQRIQVINNKIVVGTTLHTLTTLTARKITVRKISPIFQRDQRKV